MPLSHLDHTAFLVPDGDEDDDPARGLEDTLGLIAPGTAVIQIGYEDPFRLAEDLATVDVLSGGRVNVGVSVGPPSFADLIAGLADRNPGADFGHGRAERLAAALSGRPLSGEPLSGNAPSRPSSWTAPAGPAHPSPPSTPATRSTSGPPR